MAKVLGPKDVVVIDSIASGIKKGCSESGRATASGESMTEVYRTATGYPFVVSLKKLVTELNTLLQKEYTDKGYKHYLSEDGSVIESERIKFKIKKKYVNIDFGGSGAYMVELSTGDIYNIKGYGQINRKKLLGNIDTIDPEKMYVLRYNYQR